MKNGFSRGSRQQMNASRPDGRNPFRILAKESAGSAKNITPNRETSASKLPGLNGYTVASARTKSTGAPSGVTCRARASIGPDMSMPMTWPLRPTLGASAMVVAPQPQPTSRIRSPVSDLGAIDQEIGDRRQHDVLHLLAIGPMLAARPVPVRNLVGVLIVPGRGIHLVQIFDARAHGIQKTPQLGKRNPLSQVVVNHNSRFHGHGYLAEQRPLLCHEAEFVPGVGYLADIQNGPSGRQCCH